MNQKEQKDHRTKTQELGKELSTAQGDLKAMADFVDKAATQLVDHDERLKGQLTRIEQAEETHGKWRTHQIEEARQQRNYVDDQDRKLYRDLMWLRNKGFWARWWWLITGM